MKEEIALKEKTKLIEQELVTIVDKLQELDKKVEEIKELNDEIKAIKLFLGREHPDFKNTFPDLLKKVST